MNYPIEGNPAVDAQIKEQLYDERAEMADQHEEDFSDNSGLEGHEDR